MGRPNGSLTPFLMFLQLVRLIDILLAAIEGVLYIVMIIKIFQLVADDVKFKFLWFFFLMACYGVAFSVLLMLVEVRWIKVFDVFFSMGFWWVRGLFMFFLGLLSLSVLQGGVNLTDFDGEDVLDDVVEIISYILMSMGCLYVLMECFCLREVAKSDAKKTNRFPTIV